MPLPIKIQIETYKLTNNRSICKAKVLEVLNSFKTNPKNRRESELLEATVFARCLEIWSKQELLITLVNEEKSGYKGIDFFLCSTKAPKDHSAFQLLEYKAKYCGIRSTNKFANWVIGKKFLKGDNKTHLVISVATKTEFPLDLSTLRKKFESSPYLSITLTGPTKAVLDSPNFQHVLIGLQKYEYQTILDLKGNCLLSASGDCPYFKSVK